MGKWKTTKNHKGMLGKKQSEKQKEIMVKLMTGSHLSNKTREKQRLAKLGKKHTKEHNDKISEKSMGHFALSGENHPGWKGGISNKELQAGRPKPNKCECCGRLGTDSFRGICFDHDHKTGKFRGWICSECNLSIGFAGDNPKVLEMMIKYLNIHNNIINNS